MVQSITRHTTITLPYATPQELHEKAIQVISDQVQDSGEQLIDLRIENATETGLNSGEMLVELSYECWPAD